MPSADPTTFTRRALVAGTCGAACAAALSACATYRLGGPAPAPAPAPGAPDAAGAAPAPAQGGGGAAGLVAAADVPVGGGVIIAESDIVITQPTAGEYKAFSATCTHQGCPLTEVADGTINCNCHGSKFDVTDGSVVDGPADSPIAQRAVQLDGDQIILA